MLREGSRVGVIKVNGSEQVQENEVRTRCGTNEANSVRAGICSAHLFG